MNIIKSTFCTDMDMSDVIEEFVKSLEGECQAKQVYESWSDLLIKLGNERKRMSIHSEDWRRSLPDVLLIEKRLMQTAYNALTHAIVKIALSNLTIEQS